MNNNISVFTDVDGTLCFHKNKHGVELMGKNNGILQVKDPLNGNIIDCSDLSTSKYEVYISNETIKLIEEIQKLSHFILVTGGRPSTIMGRSHIFQNFDSIILENGGNIYTPSYEQDKEWKDYLENERNQLGEVVKLLESDGWILDKEGRTSSIRVRIEDNTHKSEEEFEYLKQNIQLPDGLKTTINIGALDIILKSAGKGNAILFLANKLNIGLDSSIGIGDDINDIDLLEATKEKYVLSSGYPEVLEKAKKEGWNISENPHFEGINEILRKILSQL